MPSPQPRRADYLALFAVRPRHQIRYLAAAAMASRLSYDVIAILAGNKRMSIKPMNTRFTIVGIGASTTSTAWQRTQLELAQRLSLREIEAKYCGNFS